MRPSILSAFLIAEWRNPGGACAIADNPWCARYYKEGAPTSCYFTSYQQCRATVSGVGGLCFIRRRWRRAPATANLTNGAKQGAGIDIKHRRPDQCPPSVSAGNPPPALGVSLRQVAGRSNAMRLVDHALRSSYHERHVQGVKHRPGRARCVQPSDRRLVYGYDPRHPDERMAPPGAEQKNDTRQESKMPSDQIP
jgi:hypothetical protein